MMQFRRVSLRPTTADDTHYHTRKVTPHGRTTGCLPRRYRNEQTLAPYRSGKLLGRLRQRKMPRPQRRANPRSQQTDQCLSIRAKFGSAYHAQRYPPGYRRTPAHHRHHAGMVATRPARSWRGSPRKINQKQTNDARNFGGCLSTSVVRPECVETDQRICAVFPGHCNLASRVSNFPGALVQRRNCPAAIRGNLLPADGNDKTTGFAFGASDDHQALFAAQRPCRNSAYSETVHRRWCPPA